MSPLYRQECATFSLKNEALFLYQKEPLEPPCVSPEEEVCVVDGPS